MVYWRSQRGENAMIQRGHQLKMNQPPGTLTYTGLHGEESFEMELFVISAGGVQRVKLEKVEEIQRYQGLKWLNVVGINHVAEVAAVGSFFGLSNLVMEDILHVWQRSRMRLEAGRLFSIHKMLYLHRQSLVMEHLSIVMAGDTLITFQELKADIFESLRDRIITRQGILHKRGPDYLYFVLLDILVDSYYGILDDLSEEIEYLETTILEVKDHQGERIHRMIKSLIWIKNGVLPVRDMVKRLLDEKPAFLKEDTREYFENLMGHVNQIVDIVSVYREISQSLSDTFDGQVNQQMNRIMTILTIFSAVFIPLSFLAGVFGMNFVHMPVFEWVNGFSFFLALCLLLAAGMVGFFKYQKWL